MRFHSLLFVGISLACFETSSARSISTVVQSIASHREDVPANAVVAEKIEEERSGITGSFMDKIAEKINLKMSNVKEKAKNILPHSTKQNVLDEFKSLELHKDIGEELRKKRLEVLATRAEKVSKDTKAMIKKFSEYGNDHLFGPMLVALKEANVDEAIQTNVRNAVYKSWENRLQSSVDVLTHLTWNEKPDTPRYIELLTIWIEYKKPTSDDIKMLLDIRLNINRLRVLEGLGKVKGAEDVVQLLQDGLPAFWGTSGKSAEKLFSEVAKGSTLLYVPWIKYATKDVIETTANRMMTDWANENLLKMLVAAKETERGEEVLTSVQWNLYRSLKASSQSPSKVFELLHLNDKTDTLYYTNRLSVLVEYMKKMEADISSVITYEDGNGLMVLDGLINVKDAEDVVESLQKSLIAFWAGKPLSAEETFSAIEDGGTLLYATWIKFVKTKVGTLQPIMDEVEAMKGSRNDEGLVKIIYGMEKAEIDETIQTTVRKGVYESWSQRQLSSLDIFNLMKLNEGTDSPHYTNLLSVWVEYMQATNIETDMVVTTYEGRTSLMVLDSLSKIEGAKDVAESLQKSVISFWENYKFHPRNIFYQVVDGSTSSYVTWIKFVEELNPDLKPVISEASFIQQVSNNKEDLLKMFNAYIEANTKVNIQPKLENMLIKLWSFKGLTAQDVFKELKLNERYMSDGSFNAPWMRLMALYAKNILKLPDEEMNKVIESADEKVREKLREDFESVIYDEEAQNMRSPRKPFAGTRRFV